MKKKTFFPFENFIKHPLKGIKHIYQRIRYGYSDYDSANMSEFLLNVVPGMVDYIRKNQNCHIICVPTEKKWNFTEEEIKISDAEWDRITGEIIRLLTEGPDPNPYDEEFDREFEKLEGLNMVKTDEDSLNNWYLEEEPESFTILREKYFAEEERCDKEKEENVKEAMGLIGQYFWAFHI